MERKQIQRILVVFFGLAFVGSTGFAIIGGLLGGNRSHSSNYTTNSTETPSVEEQLESQARGYTKVLEREPENTTALLGLMQVRLQTGELEQAISPLETLIELYPERNDYQELLTEINIRLAQQSQVETTTTDSTEANQE